MTKLKYLKNAIIGLETITEIFSDHLYFATIDEQYCARYENNNNSKVNGVNFVYIDETLIYENFDFDFGPFNLAALYRYFNLVDHYLKPNEHGNCHGCVVHYTTFWPQRKINAAFLIGSYAIIRLKMHPEKVYNDLTMNNTFIAFRDAAPTECTYDLGLKDCLSAIEKAFQLKLVDFKKFNVNEYEHYEKVRNGDLNWIIDNKILAFCGPHSTKTLISGYLFHHSPDFYFDYFRAKNVKTIVRLNKRVYDEAHFIVNGFEHYDLFFHDGSTPSDAIMRKFLQICEKAPAAIAVHCKAGLGRTGTLIACYLMKHYHFNAAEAIAWIRVCRPGSVIGCQQHWLAEKEAYLWLQGDIYKEKINSINNNNNICKANENLNNMVMPKKRTKNVISSLSSLNLTATRSRKERASKAEDKKNNNDNIEMAEEIDEQFTQGDFLNQMKLHRQHDDDDDEPRYTLRSSLGRRTHSQPPPVVEQRPQTSKAKSKRDSSFDDAKQKKLEKKVNKKTTRKLVECSIQETETVNKSTLVFYEKGRKKTAQAKGDEMDTAHPKYEKDINSNTINVSPISKSGGVKSS